jgi:Amt family ammonium transporter
MLASTALVLLMTPGLAFFYGGMVRSKSVLNMMMMSLSAMGLVGVLWVLYGYSLAFGNDVGGGLLGNITDYWGMKGLFVGTYTGDTQSYPLVGTIPSLVFVGFQATFAIITVALISGAVADRMKFGAWLVFAGIWATVVYFPVAHWVFAFDGATAATGGWIANTLKAIDFAGGTAVHINAGVAALALSIVLGKRRGWPREPMRPHNLTLVMLGAGLLWFGWFGFNGGSAVGSNGLAGYAMFNTIVATCGAMLAWLVVERVRDGKPTSLGAASGIVAGLVAITPSCSSVSPLGAVAVGAIAGVLCGFFADPGSGAGVAGLLYGGGVDQLWRQVVGAAAVLLYSGILTFVIAFVVKAIFKGKIRVDEDDEYTGIDETEHAETAYDFSSHRGLAGVAGTPRPDAATPQAAAHVAAGKES